MNTIFELGWTSDEEQEGSRLPMTNHGIPLMNSNLWLRETRPIRYDSSSESLASACRDVFDQPSSSYRGGLSTGASTAASTPCLLRVQSSAVISGESPESVAVIMVGLPACGKSTICRQLCSSISNLLDLVAQIYNAGDVRRRATASRLASYFNPDNARARFDRERYANTTVNSAVADLNSGQVNVAFVDATNTTADRRQRLVSAVSNNAKPGTGIILMEVRCEDDRLLRFNISGKAHNKDYCDTQYLEAIEDFSARVEHYKAAYEPITPEEVALYPISMYIVATDGGSKFDFTICDDDAFKTSHVNMIIRKFAADYMRRDGQRYLEAVDAFYSIGGP